MVKRAIKVERRKAEPFSGKGKSFLRRKAESAVLNGVGYVGAGVGGYFAGAYVGNALMRSLVGSLRDEYSAVRATNERTSTAGREAVKYVRELFRLSGFSDSEIAIYEASVRSGDTGRIHSAEQYMERAHPGVWSALGDAARQVEYLGKSIPEKTAKLEGKVDPVQKPVTGIFGKLYGGILKGKETVVGKTKGETSKQIQERKDNVDLRATTQYATGRDEATRALADIFSSAGDVREPIEILGKDANTNLVRITPLQNTYNGLIDQANQIKQLPIRDVAVASELYKQVVREDADVKTAKAMQDARFDAFKDSVMQGISPYVSIPSGIAGALVATVAFSKGKKLVRMLRKNK